MNLTLKEIIGQFLNSADQTSHQFLRLWNIGVFGMKTEFNLDIIGVYRTQILDVKPNKTVDLPCDYIKYSKIGLINDIGEIATFKRNSQLTTYTGVNTDNRLDGVVGTGIYDPTNQENLNNYNNFYTDSSMYQLFGADSGTATIGEYKIDEKSKQIFLNPHTTHTKIVLEYLCDGFDNDCGVVEIDVRAGACMLAYLRWQNAIDQSKKFSMNQVDVLKNEFYRTKRLAKMRLNPFILNELMQAQSASVKLAAKA